MSNETPSSLRLAGTLAIAGLLSGVVLAGVFLATEPRIKRNQAEALRRAIFKVLPAARDFEPLERGAGGMVRREDEGAGAPGEVVYACRDEAGQFIGHAIPAQGAGFQDVISLIYGFDPATRTIVGMEVLASRETPGLGDKIAFDPDFRANFQALQVEPVIEPVKKGAKSAANEVDCITGATISSEAVVTILNRSQEAWGTDLPTDLPPAPPPPPPSEESP